MKEIFWRLVSMPILPGSIFLSADLLLFLLRIGIFAFFNSRLNENEYYHSKIVHYLNKNTATGNTGHI